jgi:hypothetical protein
LVREELGEKGVVRPPREVVWQQMEVIPQPPVKAVIRHRAGDVEDFVNFVPSFTNSAATGN